MLNVEKHGFNIYFFHSLMTLGLRKNERGRWQRCPTEDYHLNLRLLAGFMELYSKSQFNFQLDSFGSLSSFASSVFSQSRQFV